MINLNECKFGDKLRTRGGHMVLYGCRDKDSHTCIVQQEDTGFLVVLDYADNGIYCGNAIRSSNNGFDIIGKWEDEK